MKERQNKGILKHKDPPATQGILTNLHNKPRTKWLDAQDVKQWLNVKDGTLRNWRRRGILPSSKPLGKIFYKQEDIEKMLEDHMVRK